MLPPLRISTSVRAFAWNRSAEAGSYLSVQSCVTNLTDMQLMLESVNLVVTDGDAVVLPAAGEQLSFGGPSGDPAVSPALRTAQAVNALLLQAQEAYAVSFVVRLPAAAIAAESIGRVDASWCLLMGQRGLLQSTPVRLLDARPEKQVSGTPSLSMHLQHCPATVILGQPFEVLVRVCSAAPLQQQLQVLLEANPISDSTGLCAVGRSRLALAAFTKASEQDVSVTYIAQRPGLCAVHMQLIGANPRSGAGAEEQLLCAATVLGQVFVKAAE